MTTEVAEEGSDTEDLSHDVLPGYQIDQRA
jgi:hypothetical protein